MSWNWMVTEVGEMVAAYEFNRERRQTLDIFR